MLDKAIYQPNQPQQAHTESHLPAAGAGGAQVIVNSGYCQEGKDWGGGPCSLYV